MFHTVSGQDLYQWRQWAIAAAHSHKIDPGEVDWFLRGLSDLSSLSLQLGSYRDQGNLPLAISLADCTSKWQQRIEKRTPVQYLTGETPWRNFSLTVSPDVLIPRPETELIIDIACALSEKSPIAKQLATGKWADLGTGSGAIALGLADSFPNATVYATDISEAALAIAQKNARRHHLDHRITFYLGSWLSPLTPLKGQLAGIVSNPPYIPSQTISTLQPEVADHEPHLALDGGSDGLVSLKTLIIESAIYLQPGGIYLTELMDGQAQTVASLLEDQGSYAHISIHPDLAGIQRFVSARKAL
ncbi:peptide chain release factor N(5)-glutamine methyltransferase [Leptolyngbya sp. BC1307]|uniref:peptide chain release factor N(5)-glutamine methyltransferase n=1 Tax=Leptolyngbya sp. BC1307 TaxID=2029589 RepID=UPI000EFAB9C2|nr:peptide chain release factor N(5)-glutamine methyltransferase [Leptolyngbya sp. BC1307]